jgi:hypothetical protein
MPQGNPAGYMQPPGAGAPAPAMQPGAPQGAGAQQVPPEFAQHIDPSNEFQMTLLQRIDKLGPQDEQAIAAIPPQAVAVLKKVLPEIAFLLDRIGQGEAPGGMQGEAPVQPGAHHQPGSAPAAPQGRGGGLSRL